MNRFFFTELLEGNPKLLVEMIAFNRTDVAREDALAASVPSALAPAVLRHPNLVSALRRAVVKRTPIRSDDACWDFTEESRRLAFLSAEALSRLGLLMAAAVMADDYAKVIVRQEVLELRGTLPDDVMDYALNRGRWQVGSVRAELYGLAEGKKPGEKTLRLARTMLEELRAGWPEALQERTAILFKSLSLPKVEALPEMTDASRKTLWRFARKILLRELEPECRRAFN